jgi:hypothetical protein
MGWLGLGLVVKVHVMVVFTVTVLSQRGGDEVG